MSAKRSYRTHLGPVFSEGARLLWERGVFRDPDGREGLARKLGLPRGMLAHWLYGDRQPGRTWAGELAARMRIPVASWDQEPTEPFTLPAAAIPPAADSSTRAVDRGLADAKPRARKHVQRTGTKG